MNSLEEWLPYLEQYYGANSGGELAPIIVLADELKLREFSCPIIIVGGTNGKGSTVAFLEAILLVAGYSCASYTSPHLLHFSERLKINGQPVTEFEFCQAFAIVEPRCRNFPFSYFAVITLAALYILQHQQLDYIILEVGLGGRFDPVNIVDADVMAIATIALDHTERLGNTREKIGFEKAGIMRHGKPVVCGELNPPNSVIKRAKELQAPFYCLGKEFSYEVGGENWEWRRGEQRLRKLPLPQLPMPSAAVALMIAQLLGGIPRAALVQGIAEARLLGRMQIISRQPELIVDVAHNPESGHYLAKWLLAHPISGKTSAVVAMLGDKDIAGTLQPLLPIVTSWYCGVAASPRSSSVENLGAALQKLGAEVCYTQRSVTEALAAAVAASSTSDRIVVFGSFYTVAEVLKHKRG